MPQDHATSDSAIPSDAAPAPAAAPIDAPGLTLETSLAQYLQHRALRGSTAQGLYAIERYGGDFIRWCAERGHHFVREVTARRLAAYTRWLHAYRQKNGQPLAVTSRLAKLVPLRGWLRWLARKGQLRLALLDGLDLPGSPRTLPRQLLTLRDVRAALAVPDPRTPTGLRDRALLELLFATGVRRMEAATLELADVDLQRGVALVRCGKGRRDRMLPLGERAVHWLRRYLDDARPLLAKAGGPTALFLSAKGAGLSLNWLSMLVSQHIRAAGLGKRGSCHLLRHAMATLMLEGGADIRYIQAMLGHAQLVTTQIYTHVAIGSLQAVHARCHPGVRLGDARDAQG